MVELHNLMADDFRSVGQLQLDAEGVEGERFGDEFQSLLAHLHRVLVLLHQVALEFVTLFLNFEILARLGAVVSHFLVVDHAQSRDQVLLLLPLNVQLEHLVVQLVILLYHLLVLLVDHVELLLQCFPRSLCDFLS